VSEAASGAPASRWGALIAIDLRTLAALRIGLGALLLVDLAMRAPGLAAHYSDAGVFPRALLDAMMPVVAPWSLHAWASGSLAALAALFALQALAAGCLLVGYRTRLATAVCWVLLTSLQKRNSLIAHGGDQLLSMMLFWGLFLPLGARASLDALRAAPGERTPRSVRSPATLALLLQICFVYWFAVVRRTASPVWWQGEALHYALNLDFFATPLAVWLRETPALAFTLPLLTWASLWIEIFGPLLAFSPWWNARMRLLAIALFVALHVGFGIFLHLGLFPWISVLSWLAFLPSEFWDAAARSRLAGTLAARSRDLASPFASRGAPLAVLPTPALRAAAAACLAVVVALNVLESRLPSFGGARAPWLVQAARILGIQQPWAMFSPAPPQLDGWFVFAGRVRGGGDVDALRGAALSFDKPTAPPNLLPSGRWRIYLHNLKQMPNHALMLPALTDYVCRRWNASHAERDRLESLRIVFVSELTPPPGQPPAPHSGVLMREAPCPREAS